MLMLRGQGGEVELYPKASNYYNSISYRGFIRYIYIYIQYTYTSYMECFLCKSIFL